MLYKNKKLNDSGRVKPEFAKKFVIGDVPSTRRDKFHFSSRPKHLFLMLLQTLTNTVVDGKARFDHVKIQEAVCKPDVTTSHNAAKLIEKNRHGKPRGSTIQTVPSTGAALSV